MLNKTPYELLKCIKPYISHIRTFRCKLFIHNNGKNVLGMFDSRNDEGILLGYSLYRKAYKVRNKRLMFVKERVHLLFVETNVIANQSRQDEPLRLYAENEKEKYTNQFLHLQMMLTLLCLTEKVKKTQKKDLIKIKESRLIIMREFSLVLVHVPDFKIILRNLIYKLLK